MEEGIEDSKSVLIVDSQPVGISELRKALNEDSYEVLTAKTGKDAKTWLSGRPGEIQAVLVDWFLPDATGLELLKWIKKQRGLKDAEVILESETLVSEDVRAGIRNGAYYYLTKPYEQFQLFAIVKAAASSCDLKRTLRERIKDRRDAFRLLSMGVFEVKTIGEAKALSARIAKTCDQPEISFGLFELMANAVEHGNLEIGYDKKGQLIKENRLEEERERRLAAPRYRDRRVEVRIRRRADSVELSIKDEGPGFDFNRFLVIDETRLLDPHGRGVFLAHQMLHTRYVRPGNKVEVTIRMDW